jgi:hypothetical protein
MIKISHRCLILGMMMCSFQSIGQLSGTYTIDPSGSGSTNFTSFNSATNALSSSGVSGPVVFNIAAGIYQGQVTIPAFAGASAANTVTFQSDPANTVAVEISYAAQNAYDNWVLRLTNTEHVTIKGLTLHAMGSTYSVVVQLNGVNSNIRFIENFFEGYTPSTGSSSKNGAFGNGNIPNSHAAGNWHFLNNSFSNMYSGVQLLGDLPGYSIDTCIVANNVVTSLGPGIHVGYAKYVEITNNLFTGVNAAGAYNVNTANDISKKLVVAENVFRKCRTGFSTSTTLSGNAVPPEVVVMNNDIEATQRGLTISSTDLDTGSTQIGSLLVMNNRIKVDSLSQLGLYLIGINCTAANPGKVFNNMVSMEYENSYIQSGVTLDHLRNVDLFHNSIGLFGSLTSTSNGPVLFIKQTTMSFYFPSTGVRLYNNIFLSQIGGYAVHVYPNATTSFVSDHNLYYTTGSPYFLWGYNLVTSLSAWISTTNRDINSLWGNPNFTGTKDLHITNSPAINMGQPMGVMVDIDGENRSLLTPDIGADEYAMNHYTVSVDLRNEVVDPSGIHIAGNFQGWNPTSTLLTDLDGDDIYDFTIHGDIGDTIQYKFINGDDWNDSETVPPGCQFNGTINRGFVIATTSDSADLVCYGLCVICNLGTEDGTQAFDLYPNPSHGLLTLEAVASVAAREVIVFNQLGEVMQSNVWPVNELTFQLNLDQCAAGIYVICIKSTNGETRQKVVIQ